MDRSGIPEELGAYILQKAAEMGYVVVDIAVSGRKFPCIEVVLDKDQGITLDECGQFNRDIAVWMDDQGMFSGEYSLDVCSPGLDRELKSESELLWAVDKEVYITTREPVGGESELTGMLLEISNNGDSLSLRREDGRIDQIERNKVARVRLQSGRRK